MPVPVTRASCLDSRQGGTEGLATDGDVSVAFVIQNLLVKLYVQRSLMKSI